jgi:hypothetical protein
MLYAWRRIYGLNCLIKILEKKLSNVQKENKELRNILNGEPPSNDKLNEADIIMNQIFDDKSCLKKRSAGKCILNNPANECPDSANIVCNINLTKVDNKPIEVPKNILTDIETVVVTNISEPEDIVSLITADPVAEATDNIPDHVSIISDVTDNTAGVYNRKKLSKLNLDKLKELCVSMQLSTEGTKNSLIERILAQ